MSRLEPFHLGGESTFQMVKYCFSVSKDICVLCVKWL